MLVTESFYLVGGQTISVPRVIGDDLEEHRRKMVELLFGLSSNSLNAFKPINLISWDKKSQYCIVPSQIIAYGITAK